MPNTTIKKSHFITALGSLLILVCSSATAQVSDELLRQGSGQVLQPPSDATRSHIIKQQA